MRTHLILLTALAAVLLSACSVVGTAVAVTGTVVSTAVDVTGDVISGAARTVTGSGDSDKKSK